MFKARSVLVALVVGATLTLAGCGKVTKENYDKLKVGMDFSEVTGVIGGPDKCDEAMGAKSCVWGDDTKNISVKFVAEKAVFFTNAGLSQ